MEESIKLAHQAHDFGITYLVVTPHASNDNLATQLKQRDEKLIEFRKVLKDEAIPLTLLPGLEYLADGHAADNALDNPACLLGNSADKANRPLLQELPFSISISFAEKLLFRAQLKNVPFILAHPERYTGFHDNIAMFKSLLDKGIYLQFNSDDFQSSFFSRKILKDILSLIEYAPEQILVGSDAHNPDRRPCGLYDAQEQIVKRFGEDTWKTISLKTPAGLLGIKL